MKRTLLVGWILAMLLQVAPAWAMGSIGCCGSGGGPMAFPERNVHGIWWASPANTEPGWGLSITHHGASLFVTWFTYDADGNPQWYMASEVRREVNLGTYTGRLYQATGPAFGPSPWDSSKVKLTDAGYVLMWFEGDKSGQFQYKFDATNAGGEKYITRYEFAVAPPTCTQGGPPGAASNYTDMWWKSPGGSESGWGVNLAHQGDVLFATWFTFRADGKADWVMMSNGTRSGDATWTGTLYRTRGPPLSRNSWDVSKVVVNPVGTGTFSFASPDSGTFTYTLDGVTQSKAITRYVYASPPSVCK